ncbi:uncharacterized protein LOC118701185 [Molothrus ater]|uniref:uncharacterized protein LOC118701185 n=1 Tax=Molothrus ater TaxID=84834 RepID=UPI001747E9FB|nr:uncharacterized protein LOC118701185 [Molothrus ater]
MRICRTWTPDLGCGFGIRHADAEAAIGSGCGCRGRDGIGMAMPDLGFGCRGRDEIGMRIWDSGCACRNWDGGAGFGDADLGFGMRLPGPGWDRDADAGFGMRMPGPGWRCRIRDGDAGFGMAMLDSGMERIAMETAPRCHGDGADSPPCVSPWRRSISISQHRCHGNGIPFMAVTMEHRIQPRCHGDGSPPSIPSVTMETAPPPPLLLPWRCDSTPPPPRLP